MGLAEVGTWGAPATSLPVGQTAPFARELGVSHEADVVSAHRMPTEVIDYGRGASQRGLPVLIAGAGGAAHLPGVLAAVTELPVIGVPVPLKHLYGTEPLPSHRPDASRSVGGHSLHRRGPQRGPASGPDPEGGAGAEAERLRAATRSFQAELGRVVRAKGQALRQRRA